MEPNGMAMSQPSTVDDDLDSYQHPPNVIGPGMSKILHEMERQKLDVQGEKMKRRTRVLYGILGFALVCIYFSLLKAHFFQKGPAFRTAAGGEIKGIHGSLKVELEGDKKPSKCEDGDYSKRTLKRAYELPFAAIFKDTKGQEKYEASDIIVVDGTAYAVCDNSWAISKFGTDLTPFSSKNKQIGDPEDPNREGADSGFEALFYDNSTFYILRESILQTEGDYNSVIEELDIGVDDYTVLKSCPTEFVFEGDSKGFEGVLSLRDTSNELVVLGLCEGNHCSESRKDDIGHGRFVAMKKVVADDGSCEWKTIRTIKIPKSANFRDYSAATMHDNGRVAISSQEESAIWVGQLLGYDETKGGWELDDLEFDPEEGQVLSFPKDDQCETEYCNIEGIHWLNHEMIIAVSDKMKSHGKQDFRCFDKDQSVHVFVLP